MTAGTTGLDCRFGQMVVVNSFATTPAVTVITASTMIWAYSGTNFGTLSLNMTQANQPTYWRLVYDSTAFTTTLYVSDDGWSFEYMVAVTGSATGFAAGTPPTRVFLGFTAVNVARGIVHFDWIKFTNP
jgi:hypothetical protein